MARVFGPLHSDSASGQVNNSLVFGAWKGQPYCRSYVIPMNPETGDQGDNRMIVGGLGRAASKVGVESGFHTQLTTLSKIPAGQSKQSALVKQLKTLYMTDATAFEAIYTAFEAHSAKADFTSEAADIGLADLDITYKSTDHSFSKGMMLYVLAKYGIDNSFTGSPYDTAIASWTATEIGELVADIAAA